MVNIQFAYLVHLAVVTVLLMQIWWTLKENKVGEIRHLSLQNKAKLARKATWPESPEQVSEMSQSLTA